MTERRKRAVARGVSIYFTAEELMDVLEKQTLDSVAVKIEAAANSLRDRPPSF